MDDHWEGQIEKKSVFVFVYCAVYPASTVLTQQCDQCDRNSVALTVQAVEGRHEVVNSIADSAVRNINYAIELFTENKL